MSIYDNIAPSISKTNHKYLDANNNNSTSMDPAVSDFATIAGGIAGGPVGAAVGNIAGGLFNQYLNSGLQEQQFNNQKELQQRAAHLNQAAQRQQASNQVIGLQQAGLSPAIANGAGAPSLQAGAAAGATSQLSNIFTGITELISALKAPTEIEKMVAETGKTKAETGLAEASTEKTQTEIPSIIANTAKIQQETNKLFEDTINAKNANTVWESTNNFYKTYTPTMFDEYKIKLEKSGVWESMSPKTRDTIEALANGEIELDIGGMIGLSQQIATQKNISDTDKAMLQNGLEGLLITRQMNNPNVMKALEELPANELKSMQENWKSQRSQRSLNKSTEKTQAEQRKLIKEQASGKNIENLQKELNDFNYLVSKGRYKEAAMQLLRNTGKTIQKAIPAATGAIVGGMTGGPAGAVGGAAIGTAQGLTGNDYGL